MEFRIKDINLQAEDDNLLKVGGYINVVETESEMLYSKKRNKWFKEVMKRGVFQRAIDKAKEIPLLFEHDWDKQLATTSNNTLSLKEDSIGLKFEATIEDRSVYDKVKSGLINSCSFGFTALKESFEGINNRLEKRYVSGIDLLEVSLVQNPAYVSSLVETRSYEEEIRQGAEKEEEKSKEEKPKDETEEKVETTEAEKSEENKPEDEADEKVETTETEEESKEEDPKDENDKTASTDEEEEKPEEVDKRELEVVSTEEDAPMEVPREVLKEIVDELIDAKIASLKEAENQEIQLQGHLEETKQFNNELENAITADCMKQNAEVIKMRLELLKLNALKKGI